MRPWILLAVTILLFVGCSEETSTPPEQPEKKGIEKADKQPVNELKDNRQGGGAASKQNIASEETSPKEVLASQYRHINTGDYKAAYALFDAQSHQIISLEQYKGYFRDNAPYFIDRYMFPSVNV